MTRLLRVAAVGDLHCAKTSEGAVQPLFARIAESADILVLCGDLTDYGTADEARILAKEITALKRPKLAVLGNHDFESGAADKVSRILTDTAGVTVLDGTAAVDDDWFRYAVPASVMGQAVRLCPAEETIWSKAYVMGRERYDGADIAHLIHARAEVLDWSRLARRFGQHWRVLLSHLILFGFIYPSERRCIPEPLNAVLVLGAGLIYDAAARGAVPWPLLAASAAAALVVIGLAALGRKASARA